MSTGYRATYTAWWQVREGLRESNANEGGSGEDDFHGCE